MLIGSLNLKEPTFAQIAAAAIVAEDEHEVAYACFYPQMGGYVSKCIVIFEKRKRVVALEGERPCFAALVWHDGEFAFGDEHAQPRVLHHCDPAQFVSFGMLVTHLIDKHHAKEKVGP